MNDDNVGQIRYVFENPTLFSTRACSTQEIRSHHYLQVYEHSDLLLLVLSLLSRLTQARHAEERAQLYITQFLASTDLWRSTTSLLGKFT